MKEGVKNKKRLFPKKWRWVRRIVQTLFLLAFIYLLVDTTQAVTGRLPNGLFFHLDPLTGITSVLASRSWIAPMALGIITLIMAITIGRVWCGWICPMGTVLDWIPSRRPRRNPGISTKWSNIKNFLLFAVIFSAALGSLSLIILDPITFLFRTVASVVLPGINWTVDSWLSNNQLFYLPNILLLAVFVTALSLNAVRSRFWCRYICPLGGLLGLISKVSFIRHRVNAEKCISCRKCSTLCPTGAIRPENGFTADPTECTVCLNCMEPCPTQAIDFGRPKKVMEVQDTTRRWFLVSIGAAVGAAVLLRCIPAAARTVQRFVRPPGSSEESLYNKCIRCGECMRVCPTSVIQPSPSGSEANLWTPVLITRFGYCDYSCNSCGIICPTGAIANLTLEEKRKTVIGLARVDRTRCITWVEGRDCTVCEEECPVPEKAIRLGGGGQGHGSGEGRHPQVIEELCIGCGICEHKCPVSGESAIRIYPV